MMHKILTSGWFILAGAVILAAIVILGGGPETAIAPDWWV